MASDKAERDLGPLRRGFSEVTDPEGSHLRSCRLLDQGRPLIHARPSTLDSVVFVRDVLVGIVSEQRGRDDAEDPAAQVQPSNSSRDMPELATRGMANPFAVIPALPHIERMFTSASQISLVMQPSSGELLAILVPGARMVETPVSCN